MTYELIKHSVKAYLEIRHTKAAAKAKKEIGKQLKANIDILPIEFLIDTFFVLYGCAPSILHQEETYLVTCSWHPVLNYEQDYQTHIVYYVDNATWSHTLKQALLRFIEECEFREKIEVTPKATNKKTAKKSAPLSGIYVLKNIDLSKKKK